MRTTASEVEIRQILRGEHPDPFHILGAHIVEVEEKPALAIRAFLPHASTVRVLSSELGAPLGMSNFEGSGFHEALVKNRDQIFAYRLRLTDAGGHTWDMHDPYSFWPVLSDFDLHLFAEGTDLRTYDKLGAHLMERGGVPGVFFAVCARGVSLGSGNCSYRSWAKGADTSTRSVPARGTTSF
jgi:1,4-alpha-glucan branching enzyme